MTELVDEITIKISIYPDRVPFGYASSILALRHWVTENLGNLAPMVMYQSNAEGKLSFQAGGVEIEWSNTGLQEIPEESGGDN